MLRAQTYLRVAALLLLAGRSAGAEPPQEDAPEIAGSEGALVFTSDDGRTSYALDARLFLDAAVYDEDKIVQGNGAEVRRARFAVNARVASDWFVQLDIGFADNEVEVKDAWVGYGGLGPSMIRAGQFKEPFSLEEVTSSRYLTFMERALPNVFAPGRHIGLGYNRWGDDWQVGVGLFGQEAGETTGGEDQGYGASGRVSFTPVRGESGLLHLGLGASFRTPDADPRRPDQVRFRQRPESRINRVRYLNTGRIDLVDRFTVYGAELAAVLGPFSLQAEHMSSDVSRQEDAGDLAFEGSYAFVSWFLTGESRTYLSQLGEFGQVLPKGNRGAVELALRYSTLDLNDGAVTGGEGTNVTLGVNWYINRHVRATANYVAVDNDQHADADGDPPGDDDFDVYQLRLQVTF